MKTRLALGALLAALPGAALAQNAETSWAGASKAAFELVKEAKKGGAKDQTKSPNPAPAAKRARPPAAVEPGLSSRLARLLFDQGKLSMLVTPQGKKEARCLKRQKGAGEGHNVLACLEVTTVLPKCKPKPGSLVCAAPAILRWDTGAIVVIDEEWTRKPGTVVAGPLPVKDPVFIVGQWTFRLGQDDKLYEANAFLHEAKEGEKGPFVGTLTIGDPSEPAVLDQFKDAAQRALKLVRTTEI